MILYAEVECIMYEGHSLKNKRSIIKRLIAKLKKDFNVAVAEMDYHDLWQRTKLGIVTVANDSIYANKVIEAVLETIDSFPELERTMTNVEAR
ncbi:hypothetical protein GCM10010978_03990 [Compostibacillus humi]|uniref:DUF503 domain-containing protein n=1 Tax=Compostibacillus humi TaxID=1245525 RepID=A0A8J3EJ62_9BACI|nr:DUF503 domain-containing protein [Compostibacillus humi]GGH69745.1 hypothetical protein GCM10010978_03990 [Compostibacillus humi]